VTAGELEIYLRINFLNLPHYFSPLGLKSLRELTGLGYLRLLKLYKDSNYIAFVMIALDYHA
jgi:hypothetical protein